MENGKEKIDYPLVSIAMITHDHKDYVRKSISEISKITYPNWEMVIVDNNSTDGLKDMVKRDFPWIRLIELNENRPFYARKMGFERARGKYIVVLDDDSYPEPEAIERMVYRFEQDPCLGIVAFHIPCGNLFATTSWLESPVKQDASFLACGAGIKKELFLRLNSHWADEIMELYGDERDFAVRTFAAGYTIGHFKNIIAHHRQRANEGLRNRRFMYLAGRNRNYLAGKYMRPIYWPAFYLRNIFYRSLMAYFRGSAHDVYWAFIGSVLSADYFWKGFRNRISIPLWTERVILSRICGPAINRFFSDGILRTQMISLYRRKPVGHYACTDSIYNEFKDRMVSPSENCRKIFGQIHLKFIITRSRTPQDLRVIDDYLISGLSNFRETFKNEIVSDQEISDHLAELEKELCANNRAV